MPMRMGGGGHKRVEDLEATSRANGGSLLFGDADTEIGLYHRVVALMIDQGFAVARNRALQADPLRLSDDARPVTYPDGTTETISPLARWERSLRLRPSPSATVTERRQAVAHRRGLTGWNNGGALRAILEDIFAPWPITIYKTRAADLTSFSANWPGATNTAAYPGSAPSGTLTWYSEVCGYYFGVTAPAGADAADKERRLNLANATLDDAVPAYANVAGDYE